MQLTNLSFYSFILFFVLILILPAWADMDLTQREVDAAREREKAVDGKKILADSFFDSAADYSRFIGRITDRDLTTNVVKVWAENGNVKFLRSGDNLLFAVASQKDDKLCLGYVRSSEKNYFVMHIKNIYDCWQADDFFRIGMMLRFKADILSQRVKEASINRLIILRKREDFAKQLNAVNHFLWTYEQQKIQVALDYDKKILEMERAKERAIQSFLSQKQDNIKLQGELSYRLDVLDKDLEDSRIEKIELFADRWASDLDLGLPVQTTPQSIVHGTLGERKFGDRAGKDER
ncbi:MAG: hypothetical protein A2504_08220 [Bdellovibrionales bacterium RIFOXYD12_FULL_39_22]|nr:MAG: hypothetical protein A2385_01445 [Bdellovibrionales bacterium RIFOXYB1_FULL_39_21]OFZ42890.1 MAG: hypothetical protein A2485_10925 [Bdellovibrionales bacterium RIFOXYC12_FULL_39_17]OFZ47450.1 MAG: hypothetical protein A2404_14365 [Bdellovibrionales bacterium RIFOXYC1_FULL_39_130]OFZ75538.1 MAG: hypothetical protein A2560_14515 [Bdellovibrionales bacterium RIFOXYD1_FULL_39_84]OFZ93861.1 MAG: hypothetical protein A2504_08220 [Bdellovibrionales bacterium RIFOXYD12_FULL_39_22]HLE10134.1 hy